MLVIDQFGPWADTSVNNLIKGASSLDEYTRGTEEVVWRVKNNFLLILSWSSFGQIFTNEKSLIIISRQLDSRHTDLDLRRLEPLMRRLATWLGLGRKCLQTRPDLKQHDSENCMHSGFIWRARQEIYAALSFKLHFTDAPFTVHLSITYCCPAHDTVQHTYIPTTRPLLLQWWSVGRVQRMCVSNWQPLCLLCPKLFSLHIKNFNQMENEDTPSARPATLR